MVATASGARGSNAVGNRAGVTGAGCSMGGRGIGAWVDSAGSDSGVSAGRGAWKTGAAGGNSGMTGAGDSGAVAGDNCGKTGASVTFEGADDSRALSAARDSVRAGAGGWGDKGIMGAASEGNEAVGTEGDGSDAGRDACTWACSYCGYKSLIAALNASQVFGSSNSSRVAAKVSQDVSPA